MLLGKRPRLPIKRTTSMTGIRGHLADVELEEPSEDHQNAQDPPLATAVAPNTTTINYSALVSPINLRVQSPPADHSFLRTCGLCKRRLAPGRDIYMYRGDTAFCSSECREKQIKEDEIKEYGGKKKDDPQLHAGGRVSRKKGPDGGGR